MDPKRGLPYDRPSDADPYWPKEILEAADQTWLHPIHIEVDTFAGQRYQGTLEGSDAESARVKYLTQEHVIPYESIKWLLFPEPPGPDRSDEIR